MLASETDGGKPSLVTLDLHEGEASPIRRQRRLATVRAVARADILRRASATANVNVRPFDRADQALPGFGPDVSIQSVTRTPASARPTSARA
jgi:hypothetical protein